MEDSRPGCAYVLVMRVDIQNAHHHGVADRARPQRSIFRGIGLIGPPGARALLGHYDGAIREGQLGAMAAGDPHWRCRSSRMPIP